MPDPEWRVVELDVAWIAPADLEAVAVLARLQLVARRRRVSLRLLRPSSDLLDLVRLVGLAGVVGLVEDDGTRMPR